MLLNPTVCVLCLLYVSVRRLPEPSVRCGHWPNEVNNSSATKKHNTNVEPIIVRALNPQFIKETHPHSICTFNHTHIQILHRTSSISWTNEFHPRDEALYLQTQSTTTTPFKKTTKLFFNISLLPSFITTIRTTTTSSAQHAPRCCYCPRIACAQLIWSRLS